MRETGYNASKPKKTAKPSNPEFRGSFPAVAKKSTAKKTVAKKATAPRWKSPDHARAVNKPARYSSPDAAKAGNANRNYTGRVTVTDTRPGAKGGSTTYRSAAVNPAPKPKTAAQKAAKAATSAASKYVKSGSNFMSTAPIAPKPKAKAKAKDSTKSTSSTKKTVSNVAGWRY